MENTLIIAIVAGVIGSIIASILLSFITKQQLKIILNRLFRADVRFIYKNQKQVIDDITKSFNKSTRIQILTIRGSSFIHDTGDLKLL